MQGNDIETISYLKTFNLTFRIRDFIKKKLRDEEFGFTVGQEKEMYRRDKIRQHLDGMAEDLSRSNIWSKLKTQADQHKKLVDNAKELVKESNKQPTDKVEVGDLNSVYFKSVQSVGDAKGDGRTYCAPAWDYVGAASRMQTWEIR